MPVNVVSKYGSLRIGAEPQPDASVPLQPQEPLQRRAAGCRRTGARSGGDARGSGSRPLRAMGPNCASPASGDDVNVITLGTSNTNELALPHLATGPEASPLLVSTGGAAVLDHPNDGLRLRLLARLPVSPAHVVRLSGDIRAM